MPGRAKQTPVSHEDFTRHRGLALNLTGSEGGRHAAANALNKANSRGAGQEQARDPRGNYAKQSQLVCQADGGHSPPYENWARGGRHAAANALNKANSRGAGGSKQGTPEAIMRNKANREKECQAGLARPRRMNHRAKQSQFAGSASRDVKQSQSRRSGPFVVCPQGHHRKRLAASLRTGLIVRNKANLPAGTRLAPTRAGLKPAPTSAACRAKQSQFAGTGDILPQNTVQYYEFIAEEAVIYCLPRPTPIE